jgi:ATP-dependent DNA helicase RecG
VLAKQPLQRSEIADALGHDKVSGAVNRAIKELLAKQLIEYTIPDKPNSRLQKYRLTPLGRRLLATEGNRHES